MRQGCLWLMVIAFSLAIAMLLWLYGHTTRYDDMIGLSAARHGVDFYLVKALIFEESWFRSEIRGGSGEIGLMQITAAAARDFSDRKGFPPLTDARLFEPALNIEIGCWYLRQSLDRYRASPAPALFALLRYNAGEVRADAWLQSALAKPAPTGVQDERYYLSLVDFPTTREYVRRILQRARSHNFWF
jgi:soluble lytic murein transglycosylase